MTLNKGRKLNEMYNIGSDSVNWGEWGAWGVDMQKKVDIFRKRY